jgi:hypothetical protein
MFSLGIRLPKKLFMHISKIHLLTYNLRSYNTLFVDVRLSKYFPNAERTKQYSLIQFITLKCIFIQGVRILAIDKL